MIIAGTESFFLPGNGEKEAVLLLQGFAGNTAELLPLGNFLNAQGYTVLAPRLPGHVSLPVLRCSGTAGEIQL